MRPNRHWKRIDFLEMLMVMKQTSNFATTFGTIFGTRRLFSKKYHKQEAIDIQHFPLVLVCEFATMFSYSIYQRYTKGIQLHAIRGKGILSQWTHTDVWKCEFVNLWRVAFSHIHTFTQKCVLVFWALYIIYLYYNIMSIFWTHTDVWICESVNGASAFLV